MNYFYAEQGKQQGPVTLQQLRAIPELNPDTLVWHSGMKEWQKASTLDELKDVFAATPPPVPIPVGIPIPSEMTTPPTPATPVAPVVSAQPVAKVSPVANSAPATQAAPAPAAKNAMFKGVTVDVEKKEQPAKVVETAPAETTDDETVIAETPTTEAVPAETKPAETNKATTPTTTKKSKKKSTTKKKTCPKTWKSEAIFVTLCFCPFIGIVAIYCAMQVEKLYYKDDYKGAQAMSKHANTWTQIAFFIGCILWSWVFYLYCLSDV